MESDVDGLGGRSGGGAEDAGFEEVGGGGDEEGPEVAPPPAPGVPGLFDADYAPTIVWIEDWLKGEPSKEQMKSALITLGLYASTLERMIREYLVEGLNDA